MRKPYMTICAVLALNLLACPRPTAAQHGARRAGGGGAIGGHLPAPHGQQHFNPGQMQPSQQQIREAQRMEQMAREFQARQAEAARQAHLQNLHRFEEWRRNNMASSGQHTTGSGSSVPESPEAFRQWYNTQKRNRALKKSYDRAYDQVREFEKSQEQNRPSRKNEPRQAMAANRLSLAAEQRVISLLHAAHTKLRGADHDYDGHRVRAMEHVASALHHLGYSSIGSANIAPGAGNLPQGQSDTMLREALSHLRATETSLGSATNSAARHRNARTSVGEAMRELETALSIR